MSGMNKNRLAAFVAGFAVAAGAPVIFPRLAEEVLELSLRPGAQD
jgi:hypothetical protein